MTSEIHRFTVGAFECIALSDGSDSMPANRLFTSAPPDDLARTLAAFKVDPDAVRVAYNILYINTGSHRILVDTGLPAGANPNAGHFPGNFKAAGLNPLDIDQVIITHAHGDHIGGLTDNAGNLTYPNAHYNIARIEWEHWTNEDTLAKMDANRAALVRTKLGAIKDRLTLIDSEHEAEILPGICAIHAPGHTPGQMGLWLESNGEHLLLAADATHHPLQAEHPDWSLAFDNNGQVSAVTRRALFMRAAQAGAYFMTYHYASPGVGRVTQVGDHFLWQPL